MNTKDDPGIGLDTSMLQAVDDYMNQIARKLSPEETAGSPYQNEPKAREQFIRAVDAFLDLPAIHLVIPKEELGHLAPLGDAIAQQAIALERATEEQPLALARRISLYTRFLALVKDELRFRQDAFAWAWFQFLDDDVLRGYADRMEVKESSGFLKDEMNSAFAQAFGDIPKAGRKDLARLAAETSDSLKHGREQIVAKARSLEAIDSSDATGVANLVALLLDEIREYKNVAETMHLDKDYGTSLFLLAYVGSVFMRGWEYVDAYSYHRGRHPPIYLPHQVRGDFLLKTCTDASYKASAPRRWYWWSWGSLLVKAIEERPSVLGPGRVSEILTDLRHDLHHAKVSNSDCNPPPANLDEKLPKELKYLPDLALKHALVLKADAQAAPIESWAPALGRTAFAGGGAAAATLLSFLVPSINAQVAVAFFVKSATEWVAQRHAAEISTASIATASFLVDRSLQAYGRGLHCLINRERRPSALSTLIRGKAQPGLDRMASVAIAGRWDAADASELRLEPPSPE